MEKVDVIICSKDRSNIICNTIEHIKKLIPYNNIIIVDSSEKPYSVLNGLGVKLVHTPNANLGFARQQGLLNAETEVVMIVDDDLILEEDWFELMIPILKQDEKTLAVSCKIIFGHGTNEVIEKIHRAGKRREGACGGANLMKRNEVLKLGGFNTNIHRGEDMELELRINQHGFKWMKQQEAIAYHPCTYPQFLKRAQQDGWGWIMVWYHSSSGNRLRFIARRLVSTFLMPFYYTFLTRDFRVLAYYSTYKIKSLFTFITEVHKGCRRFEF